MGHDACYSSTTTFTRLKRTRTFWSRFLRRSASEVVFLLVESGFRDRLVSHPVLRHLYPSVVLSFQFEHTQMVPRHFLLSYPSFQFVLSHTNGLFLLFIAAIAGSFRLLRSRNPAHCSRTSVWRTLVIFEKNLDRCTFASFPFPLVWRLVGPKMSRLICLFQYLFLDEFSKWLRFRSALD